MLGTLGCLNPQSLATYAGVQIDEPVWFQAGAHVFPEGSLGYIGSSNLVHAQSILAVVACLFSLPFFFALMGAFEAYHLKSGPLCVHL